jgi:hypothetical protein
MLVNQPELLFKPVPGSLNKKERRRFHLLLSKKCHLLPPFLCGQIKSHVQLATHVLLCGQSKNHVQLATHML